MHHLDLQAPPEKPLHDTWQWRHNIGGWLISIGYDYDNKPVKEVNAKFSEQIREYFSCFNWHRAWKVTIYARTIKNSKHFIEETLEWSFETPYEEFLNGCLQKIQNSSEKVRSVEIELDMFVHTRTEQSPDKVVCVWIRGYADVTTADASDGIYSALHMFSTVFCRYSPDLDDNEELYNLNQPILSESLQAWERKFGEIIADDGHFGIYPHGFLLWPDDMV